MFHDLIKFKELVKSSNWCYLNKKVPFRTLDNLGWDNQQVENVLCALTDRDFQKLVPNCRVTEFLGCEFVDAAQYEIYWNEVSNTRQDAWSKEIISLSLKIAVVTDDEGQAAGLVTFHLSGGM